MGIFQEMSIVVNRSPVMLTCRFDGQEISMPPGESQLPTLAVSYAKNQNPIMGTQDPGNPSMSGCKYLIGVLGSKDNCKSLTPDEWAAHLGQPCRLDTEAFFEDRLGPKERMVVKGRKTVSAYEARQVVSNEFAGPGERD